MLRCVQTGCVAERPKVMEQILRVFKNLVFFLRVWIIPRVLNIVILFGIFF